MFMILETKKVELRKLTASEGMYLTQAADTVEVRSYARCIYLGKGDKAENWREATEEEKVQYEAEQKARNEADNLQGHVVE